MLSCRALWTAGLWLPLPMLQLTEMSLLLKAVRRRLTAVLGASIMKCRGLVVRVAFSVSVRAVNSSADWATAWSCGDCVTQLC